MDQPDAARQAMRGLIAYWRSNPHAADTADGIQRWWLADLSLSRHAIDAALQHLVDEGRATAVTAADGRVRYRWVGGKT